MDSGIKSISQDQWIQNEEADEGSRIDGRGGAIAPPMPLNIRKKVASSTPNISTSVNGAPRKVICTPKTSHFPPGLERTDENVDQELIELSEPDFDNSESNDMVEISPNKELNAALQAIQSPELPTKPNVNEEMFTNSSYHRCENRDLKAEIEESKIGQEVSTSY